MVTETDIQRLLTYASSLKSDDFVRRGTANLLRHNLDWSIGLTLASYARILFDSKAEGHISANLISNAAAERIKSLATTKALFDQELIGPLDDQSLRIANQNEGSTLLITSFFWNNNEVIGDQLHFAKQGMQRMARWFEGNTISCVMFSIWNEFVPRIESVLNGIRSENVWSCQLENELMLYAIDGPYDHSSIAFEWLEPLLKHYREPDRTMPDRYKLRGRLYFENDFNYLLVDQSCTPTVTSPEASYNKWRTSLGLEMDINRSGYKGADVATEIKRIITDNPRILTLY